MDYSIHEQESGTQDQKSFLASLLILNSIMNWLVSIIKLTEEEQQDAGIYPGRLGTNKDRSNAFSLAYTCVYITQAAIGSHYYSIRRKRNDLRKSRI